MPTAVSPLGCGTCASPTPPSLIADLMSGTITEAEGRVRRDELQQAARDAYADAPRTSTKAFKRAQDGLKNNEEMTFTSNEIDLFLPEALRLNAGQAPS